MAIHTLRSKNQVTLPAEVVSRAGLHAGQPLDFQLYDGGILIKAFQLKNDDDWLTDEVMNEIETAAAETPGPGYDSADDMIAALRRG